MNTKDLKVDVIIPTYGPGPELEQLLQGLRQQSYPIRQLIVVNTDRQLWESQGLDRLISPYQLTLSHITRQEFDHGGTRGKAAAGCDGDILLFMTQDAQPVDQWLVQHLIEAFEDSQVAVAYARQLPAKDCGDVERFARSFNYPQKDQKKSRADLERLGIKTYFSSNVCAAYSREIYERLGGFIRHTIFNEDMIFAGKAVKMGYSIAYCSQALVVHSHNYSAMEYLKRNFDLGVSQADHPEIFGDVPSEGEGMRLVRQTAGFLIQSGKPHRIFYLIWISGFKFLGYRLGKSYERLPRFMIQKLTMNPGYWDFP